VAAHTLQISKILACPAPRAGDIVRLDASASNNSGDGDAGSLEIVARFPGGLDFGKGLVDINFTMWPFFKALSLDNILNVCEVALAPTGRVLFLSRYPAMLSTAVLSLKYLAELRGWNGIAHPNAHCRDAKIYVDDPGPWIIGLSTESRYSVRPSPEVCICDLDINYVNCPAPPAYSLSIKHQRERFKQQLVSAFDSYYSADYLIPSEFKEAFPAGRFRPLCKIQAKRGVSNAAASVISEAIKAPEWWNGPKVLQTLDVILTEKMKRPSFLKRLTRTGKMPPRLTVAEQAIQLSIRKRAAAFVDARDDLETKIGRLSRRLNFLVTESDLWREKFITFEQYAEKLSTEATDLRVKINREQRESKRLSGMISATAHEKIRLESSKPTLLLKEKVASLIHF
jgi:nicotinamide N-methyltransferase